MKFYITEDEFKLIKYVLSLKEEEFNKIQHKEFPNYEEFHKIAQLKYDNENYYMENSQNLLYSLQDFFMNFTIYQGFDKNYNLIEYGKISDKIWYKLNALYEK